MKAAAAQKGLKLESRYDESLPEIFLGDKLRIRQILSNLIGNAIKFTQQGGISVHARKIGLGDHALIEIAISDTGIGIANDRQSAIFEEFCQADESTARKFGGTGLGLAISRQLADLMGGTTSLQSELGKGATFFVTLPVRSVEVNIKKLQEGPFGAELEDILPTKRRKILVAEDNQISQQFIKTLLAKYGHEYVLVRNGLEAIDALENARNLARPFELVLMDIQMPDLDGIEATRKIRGRGFSVSNLAIIAMTVSAYDQDTKDALAAGMQAYLVKPVNVVQLLAVIDEWMPLEDQSAG